MADGATSLEEDQAQFALMVALCASVICVGLWLSFLVSQVVYRLGWKKVLHARAGTFDCPHSLHNTAFPPLTLPPSSQHTHNLLFSDPPTLHPPPSPYTHRSSTSTPSEKSPLSASPSSSSSSLSADTYIGPSTVGAAAGCSFSCHSSR